MFSYLIFSLSFAFLVVVGVIYITRTYWMEYIPANIPFLSQFHIPFFYDPVPSTFEDDAARGLHSSNFDLSGNIESGDSRGGLDLKGKREVERIMKRRGVGFDEARRIVMMDRFRRAGVSDDGTPTDPKFVSFGK